MPTIKRGLEGVYVAESHLGFINGKKGILRYVGYDIEDLAENASFEEVLYLLWHGKLPKKKDLRAFDKKLRAHRKLPPAMLRWIKTLPRKAHPMDVLRTATSALALHAKHLDEHSHKAVIGKAVCLAASFPTIIASFERHKQEKRIVSPKTDLSLAGNFLYMLKGKKPTKAEERVMDVCLILHAEHGLNASAFSGRVTVSTLADVYAGITSAIGTLKGPLHGGANERVLKMLKEIKFAKHAEKAIMKKIKKHEKIMGFGHRVYKVKDPRAHILQRYAQHLSEEAGNPRWYKLSEEIERVVTRELGKKKIYPNVDFYSASTYHYLGIPTDLFTSIFACSRIGGWIGHIIEQYDFNRIMRPRAVNLESKKKRFVPVNKR